MKRAEERRKDQSCPTHLPWAWAWSASRLTQDLVTGLSVIASLRGTLGTYGPRGTAPILRRSLSLSLALWWGACGGLLWWCCLLIAWLFWCYYEGLLVIVSGFLLLLLLWVAFLLLLLWAFFIFILFIEFFAYHYCELFGYCCCCYCGWEFVLLGDILVFVMVVVVILLALRFFSSHVVVIFCSVILLSPSPSFFTALNAVFSLAFLSIFCPGEIKE